MSEPLSKPMANIPVESVDQGFAKWIEKGPIKLTPPLPVTN